LIVSLTYSFKLNLGVFTSEYILQVFAGSSLLLEQILSLRSQADRTISLRLLLLLICVVFVSLLSL